MTKQPERLTKEREAEIRKHCLEGGCKFGHCGWLADLLAEIDRLREENAQLLQARDHHFDAATRYFDEMATSHEVIDSLEAKLAKAREALRQSRAVFMEFREYYGEPDPSDDGIVVVIDQALKETE